MSPKKIPFPQLSSPQAALSIFEEGIVPFPIKRVFTVQATQACRRGFHAHKKCTQLLVVLSGECTVVCDDGKNKSTYTLNNAAEGLLIPPSIWAEQEYKANTVLMVLTDRPYEEDDYIHEYNAFLEYRKVL